MIKNTLLSFYVKTLFSGKSVKLWMNEKNKGTVKKNLLAGGKNIYGKDKSYPWKA